MIEINKAEVKKVLALNYDKTEVLLDIDHPVKKAINYNHMTGEISTGDIVYLNTTAASLSLGTGGFHFVIANISHDNINYLPKGHGMKLRYTPMQVQIPFVEEEGKNRKIYNKPLILNNKQLIFAELHSMLPPICAYLKKFSSRKTTISYIMTDHAALPLSFSKNIQSLRTKKLLDITLTTGNAFGGDYECVNFYTALQTASSISDIIVIAMGPGITGTGTKYGFSGLELAFYMNLASKHGGGCVFIPRVSFADQRIRHYGISHHSLTIISEMLTHPVFIALPHANNKKLDFMIKQLKAAKALYKTRLSIYKGDAIKSALESYCINTTTMGRGFVDDPYFFYTIGASCKKTLSML
ncbi:MAG TPA: DUF3866 family protein [Bacillota bacterium]|nr:DUF3866 family protein [Bacillota bacterium]